MRFFVRHPFSVKMQWHTGYRKGTGGVALKGLNDNCILWLKLEFLWYMYVNLKHKYVIFWQQLLKLQKQVFNARKHRRYILQVWETHKNSFMWRDTVLVYGYIYMCVILVSKKEDFFILSSRLEFTILLILSIYTKPLPLLTPAVCRVVNLRVCGLISHGHSELLSYCLVLMTKQEKNILGISIDTIKFSWNTIAMVLMGCLSLFFGLFYLQWYI